MRRRCLLEGLAPSHDTQAISEQHPWRIVGKPHGTQSQGGIGELSRVSDHSGRENSCTHLVRTGIEPAVNRTRYRRRPGSNPVYSDFTTAANTARFISAVMPSRPSALCQFAKPTTTVNGSPATM